MVETRWKTWTEKEREALLSLLDTEPTRIAIKEAISTMSKRFGLAGIRSIKSTFHMALLGVNKMCASLNLPLRDIVPDPKSLTEHGAALPQYLTSAINKKELKKIMRDPDLLRVTLTQNSVLLLRSLIRANGVEGPRTSSEPQVRHAAICSLCGKRKPRGSDLSLQTVPETVTMRFLPFHSSIHAALVRTGFNPRLEIT